MINTIDILGLILWYLKSSDRQYKLSPIFDIAPSSLSVWIDYGLELMLKICKNRLHNDLRVDWPNHMEMEESARLLMEKRPNGELLSNISAVLDGGRLPWADYVDTDVHNTYYEGYKTSVDVTNLLAFNFKGELVHAALNYPGSWYDSKVAHMSGLIFPTLYEDEISPRGFAVLCDSSLSAGRIMDDKILRGRKTN